LRQYEKIVSTSKELMSLLDKNYVYQSVNEAYFRAYNRKREDIIGHTVADLLGDEVFNEKVRDKLDRCLTGETVSYRGWFNFPGLGKRFMEANYYPYREEDNSISGIVINARDITRTHELENQLQQSQKREAIGTLAGGIAHDFNNILASVIGYAELSIDLVDTDTTLHKNLEAVFKAGVRAKDLVKQILTFSRQADQELRPIKLQPVVGEILKLSRSTIPSTIEIMQDISNACGSVMADSVQIHQIALNLITNAYHAMQDTGGKLEVTLNEVELTAIDIKDKAMSPGPYACLTVADTGHGIQKSLMDRIFDPYFTTKAKDKGTGLGLAVVQGIVNSYGGDISVYSEPGVGTTFRIYLPIIEAKREEKGSEDVDPAVGGKERILLVDDEEPIAIMEKEMLERLGYDVTMQTNSSEALKTFRSDPAQFDLVITDMSMPKMTGIEFSNKLIKSRPNIPIILCSGFSEQIREGNTAEFGIREYVMKPMLMSELAQKIRKILEPA